MKHQSRLAGLRLTAMLFVLAISVVDCSSTYAVSPAGKPDAEYSYQELNEELAGRDATIGLKDGAEKFAKEVTISGDSVSWVDWETGGAFKSRGGDIQRIVIQNYVQGGVDGLLIGMLGGGGLGALVGQILATESGTQTLGSGYGAAFGALFGGGGGLFIGLITGAIIGHDDNYEFTTIAQRDSLQNAK